jgi:hypothetical protein
VPVQVEVAPEPAVADCVDLTFTDGNTGTYTVVEGGESHEKHHFNMPEGKDALVLKVTWPDDTWTMDVAAGQGGCPHSGTTRATVTATKDARLFIPATQISETGPFTAGEVWFLHLGATGTHAAGEAEPYTMAGQACTIVKPEAAPAVPGPSEVKHSPPMKASPAETIRERKAQGAGKAGKGKEQ